MCWWLNRKKVIASSLAQMATLKTPAAGTKQATYSSLYLNMAICVVSAVMPLKQHWRLEVVLCRA